MTALRPIFIFSLPRSGSTLLQRLLTTQEEIASVAEPWLLLPFLYTLKQNRSFADYAQFSTVNAIQDLYNQFPNGVDDYLYELSNFVLRLYAKAAYEKEYKYFLDKTPRYHLVVDEIIRMFPDGKFIFLWRNPLAIIASIIESFGKGKWFIYRYNVDLFRGAENLTKAFQNYSNQVHSLRYEDILINPELELVRLFKYLEIDPQFERLSEFHQIKFSGRFGDATGVKNYQTISIDPLDKWKRILTNPVRRRWCRNYLEWLGDERLTLMGYDKNGLNSELNTIPMNIRFVGADIWANLFGFLFRLFDLRMFKRKIESAKSWHDINAHT